MTHKNVAVIGANGFIGSNLTEKLRQLPSINIFLFGRSKLASTANNYFQIDISDTQEVTKYFSNIDIVYYLASETIPATSWEDPIIEVEKNLLPFLKFTKQITSFNVKKIVFVSSGGTIYGPSDTDVSEKAFANPFSPYGINKLTMEHYLNYFREKNGLQHDIFRISNIYGHGQNTSKGIGIINTFLEHILHHQKIQIFGDGETVRNYIYIDDVTDLLTLSLRADNISNVFNTSSNDTLTINNLVGVIKTVVQENFEVLYTPTRKSDNPAIHLDNTKILKYYPDFTFTPLSEGIFKTYEYMRSRR